MTRCWFCYLYDGGVGIGDVALAVAILDALSSGRKHAVRMLPSYRTAATFLVGLLRAYIRLVGGSYCCLDPCPCRCPSVTSVGLNPCAVLGSRRVHRRTRYGSSS